MMKKEAIEEVKTLIGKRKDKRYSIDNKYLIKRRIWALTTKFNIKYKDIWDV